MERHGICRNVGVCSRANKEQVITDDDAEFVCPECGEPLEEVKEKPKETGKGNKKPLLIGAAVIILAAAGIGVGVAVSGGDSKPKAVTQPEKTEVKTDTAKAEPVKAEQEKENAADAAKDNGAATAKDTKGEKKAPKTDPQPAKTPKYSFASFDGTTMVFKQRHTIPGTSQVAEPGDKVTGVWSNGEVNSVRWYHADGSASEVLTHE